MESIYMSFFYLLNGFVDMIFMWKFGTRLANSWLVVISLYVGCLAVLDEVELNFVGFDWGLFLVNQKIALRAWGFWDFDLLEWEAGRWRGMGLSLGDMGDDL